jgi:hypothetical protein
MSQMGATSQVTNCDRFIRETGKGVAPVGNVWDIDRALVKPFIGYLGQIRERLEMWGNPYLWCTGYGG